MNTFVDIAYNILTYIKMYAITYLREAMDMTNTNITNFRKNIYEMLETTIEYNEPINISTKKGNAVVLSEEDYNNLMETLYIMSVPGLKDEILKRGKDSKEEFVSEDEVEW